MEKKRKKERNYFLCGAFYHLDADYGIRTECFIVFDMYLDVHRIPFARTQ